MQTNIQNPSSAKQAIIKKLDKLPDALVQTVSTILDDLIDYHQKTISTPNVSEKIVADDKSSIEPITTWDQFFDEIQQLPEAPELVGMTKQQRKALMTEYLQEKYKDTDLGWS
ncbi:MAG: hypothetical protein AAFR58_17000 [Cyanobacteria bacterium J06627_28]